MYSETERDLWGVAAEEHEALLALEQRFLHNLIPRE